MSIKEKLAEIKGRLWADGYLTLGLVLLVGIGAFLLGRSSLNTSQTALPAAIPMHTVDMSQQSATANSDGRLSGIPTISAAATATARNETGTTSSKAIEHSVSSSLLYSETQQEYVGSRKGKRYHLPTCPGAKTIAEKNRIVFRSKAEAEARGYTPAANCKGI